MKRIPPPKGELRDALDGVVLDQLLRREGSLYSFAHAALEQAAYAGLEEKTRRSLHGQAAAWLLQESPPEKEPPLEELCLLYTSDAADE